MANINNPKVLVDYLDLKAIADAIRAKNDTTEDLSINEIPLEIGGIVGADLPELENEGVASDLLADKQLIDGKGHVVTGTIKTKTASDLTASGATVTVPAGYYASKTTKSVATTTQATPSISITSNGLITATASQSGGYVNSGTRSATRQLATQGGTEITPSTEVQTAVNSGVYTTGAIVVNPIPSNYEDVATETGVYTSELDELKAQLDALGEALEGKTAGGGGGSSSGGNTDMEAALIGGELTVYENDRVKYIKDYMFYEYYGLTSVNFPACTSIGGSAFYICADLVSVNIPSCTYIGEMTFAECYNLTSINCPACTDIGGYAFGYCPSLESINLPACTTIGSGAFAACPSLVSVSLPSCIEICPEVFVGCANLNTIYLTGADFCSLQDSAEYIFMDSGITPETGYIYVNPELLEDYKQDENWSYLSDRIFAYEG